MNHQEREEFWNMLHSLQGKDPEAECNQLRQIIKLPKYLFRYRSVNMQSLEALRTNKLYFSSANYYDDPFDTFLHINVEKIKEECETILKHLTDKEAVIEGVKTMFAGILTEEQLKQITVEKLEKLFLPEFMQNFLSSVLAIRDEVKRDTWAVCFSENGFNEVLWLKYADQYKGFVQIYDLENDANLLCGKKQECEACGIQKYGTPLYPIYYSDTPYDATNFAKAIMLRKMGEMAQILIPMEIYTEMGLGYWEREKTTLIKKECHKYDQEWRMITNSSMNPPVMRAWIPSGIILGLRMNPAEENIVISMAKEAGIKKIYKSYINDENQLDIKTIYSVDM